MTYPPDRHRNFRIEKSNNEWKIMTTKEFNDLFNVINERNDMEKEEKIFGRSGSDLITGFKGVITGECKYITGCTQYCLSNEKEDRWVDKPRVQLGKMEVELPELGSEPMGGGKAPERRNGPNS